MRTHRLHRIIQRKPGELLLKWVCIGLGLFLSPSALLRAESSAPAAGAATVIVAVGAAGEEEFGVEFARSAGLWKEAAARGGAECIVIGMEETGGSSDLELLRRAIELESTESPGELWLVLIGHGTFDGKEARFNLRGPDLTATELAAWLQPVRRPVAVINCSSSSAPFISKLSAPGRVVMTATRSGFEQNYARFGRYMAESIADPAADLDKDGQTSLLEAFLMASRLAAEFYELEGRLATEHALLDDTGDGLGTPPDWFRGVRAIKKPSEGGLVDGLRAHQFHLVRSEEELRMTAETRLRRDELELAVARLRDRKADFNEEEYYGRLENLLMELARLYR